MECCQPIFGNAIIECELNESDNKVFVQCLVRSFQIELETKLARWKKVVFASDQTEVVIEHCERSLRIEIDALTLKKSRNSARSMNPNSKEGKSALNELILSVPSF